MALQSNAQVLPDEDENGSIEGLTTETVVEEVVETAAPSDNSQPVVEDDEIPEQLRGKSPKELAAMYVEAQKMIGRHGAEIGELRRMTDTLVKKELERRAAPPKPAEPAKPETDPVDYFADPEKAISSVVERHPLVKKLLEENAKLGGTIAQNLQEKATARFNELHPDAGQILTNEKFRKWVSESKIRQHLLLQAHTKYDVDAGHELLSTWKALNPPAPPAAEPTGKTKAAAAASAAAVPSGGNASPTGGGKSGGAGGKIYRRADIMRLMEDDPDRYEAMSAEIQKAYEEGRVR